MSTGAVVMLVVSAVVIWGGLAAALVNLLRGGRPEHPPRRDL